MFFTTHNLKFHSIWVRVVVVRRKAWITWICLWVMVSFSSIWALTWLDIYLAVRFHVSDNLIQFGGLGGDSRKIRSSHHLIWLTCVWVLLKGNERSHFSTKIIVITSIIWQSELLSFWWLKTNNKNLSFDIHHWWINPCNALSWSFGLFTS